MKFSMKTVIIFSFIHCFVQYINSRFCGFIVNMASKSLFFGNMVDSKFMTCIKTLTKHLKMKGVKFV